jgi:hypothetical protein
LQCYGDIERQSYRAAIIRLIAEHSEVGRTHHRAAIEVISVPFQRRDDVGRQYYRAAFIRLKEEYAEVGRQQQNRVAIDVNFCFYVMYFIL